MKIILKLTACAVLSLFVLSGYDVEHVSTVVGEFSYEPLRDWGPEIVKKIDFSCDFMLVGRKNN